MPTKPSDHKTTSFYTSVDEMRCLSVQVSQRLLMAASYLLYKHDSSIDLLANSWQQGKLSGFVDMLYYSFKVMLQHKIIGSNVVATVWRRLFPIFKMAVPPCTKRQREIHAEIVVFCSRETWTQSNPTTLGSAGALSASQVLSPNAVADLTQAPVAEWEQLPAARFSKSYRKPSKKSGGCYSCRFM